MPIVTRIVPCLWFDDQAEEAASFYTSIFSNSKIGTIARYGEAGHEIHGRPAGSVLTVAFELDGQPFTALNGGPVFRFNKLSAGGDAKAQQCGWLKDRFGVSWQVVPEIVTQLVSDPDSEKSQRAMQALLQMKKLDIAELKRAYAG